MICKLCQGIIQSELTQRSRAATFPSSTDTRTITRASAHTSRASKHERTGIHVVWKAGNHDNCYCPGSHVRPVECATTRSYPGPSASRRTFVRCLRKGSLSIKTVKAQGDRGCRGSSMETLLTKKEIHVRGHDWFVFEPPLSSENIHTARSYHAVAGSGYIVREGDRRRRGIMWLLANLTRSSSS